VIFRPDRTHAGSELAGGRRSSAAGSRLDESALGSPRWSPIKCILAVRCGLDGPQLPWGWTVNEIPSTPWPQYATVSPPPASGEPSGEARKGRTACRRLGAPSRHLPSSSSAQSTVASVCALARTRDAARAGSAPAGGRPPWRSIASSVCSDERAARGNAAVATPDSARWRSTGVGRAVHRGCLLLFGC